MEFVKEFAFVQGALLSIQKANGKLKTLNSSNLDDKQIIDKTVESLKNVLQKVFREGTATQNDDISWRIGFYLILNTDFTVHNDLLEDQNCGHLVGSAPTLSKDVLIEIFWSTPLKTFICEPILLCPPVLSLELIDLVAVKLKGEPRKLEYPFIVTLLSCIYKRLLSLTASEDKKGVHNCQINCVALKYLNSFSSLLIYFKRSELQSVAKNDIVQEFGCLVKWSVELIIACLECYLHSASSTKVESEVYSMNLPFDYKNWHQESDKEVCAQFHELLFAHLMEHIAFISVDIWMQWSEFVSNFVSGCSVQRDVGESVYKCIELLKESEKQHIDCHIIKDLLPMLSSLAIKPLDEDDEIEAADISLILERILDESSSQKKWFKALLERSEDILSKEECVECIKSNISLTDMETSVLLLNRVVTLLKNTGENNERTSSLRLLCMESIKQLQFPEQIDVLTGYLSNYGINNYLLCDNYEISAVKIFNTVVDESEDFLGERCYSDVLLLSLQDTQDVIQRLVKHSVTSDKQALLMAEIIGVLKPLWTLPKSNTANSCDNSSLLMYTLSTVMQNHKEMEFMESSFISFVVKLVNNGALSIKEFSEDFLLQFLHKSVLEEDWEDTILCLQALKVFFDETLSIRSTLKPAILLVMLTQILERGRKYIYDFSTLSLQACEKAIDIINMLSTCTIDETTLMWTQKKLVSSISPINFLYCCELWTKLDTKLDLTIDWKLLMLHKARLEKCNLKIPETDNVFDSRHELTGILIQMLPASTSQEWMVITQYLLDISSTAEVSSLFVFDLLINSITIMISLIEIHSTEAGDQMITCVDYCIRNFGLAVKEVFLSNQKSLSAVTLSSMLHKFVHMSQKLPATVQESCSGIILNIEMALISRAFAELESGIVQTEKEEDQQTIHSRCNIVVRAMVISLLMVENKGTRQALARKLQNKLKYFPCSFT